MEMVELNMETRKQTGKEIARKVRREGRIPGIVYGRHMEAVPVSVDYREFNRAVHSGSAGEHTLLQVKSSDKRIHDLKLLLKDMQVDPIRRDYLHLDFIEVRMTEKIQVEVSLRFEGVPVGVKLGGGILEHSRRSIEIECLPNNIPNEIVVDVSQLEIGDNIQVSDLVLPEGVELYSDGEFAVASVAAPREEEEAPVAEAQTLAEPEVTGQKGTSDEAVKEGEKEKE